MSEIDMEYFISLIEERPVIWDVNNSDYKNKFIKHDAWKSVCESLFPNFQERENSERTELGNEVIKRWKGVKDSFNKYEKKLKDASRTGSGPKIKEYHLYKQLLFLKSNFSNENTVTEVEIEQPVQPPPERPEKLPRHYKKIPKRKITTEYEDDVVKILQEPSNKHISFFKGILPSVERLDENNTVLFQSRVLQVLTELLQCQPFDYGYPNSSYQNSYQAQHLATPHRSGKKRSSSNGIEDSSSCSSYHMPSSVPDSQGYGRQSDITDTLPEGTVPPLVGAAVRLRAHACKTCGRSAVRSLVLNVKDMIASVYSYLYTEYNNLKFFSGAGNLSPLANILQRTASATGASEHTISAILEEKKLATDDELEAGPAKRVKLNQHYGDDVSITDEESSCGVDLAQSRDDVDRQDEAMLPLEKIKFEVVEDHENNSSDLLEQQTNEAASAVHHLLSNIEVKIEPPEVKIEPADDDDPHITDGESNCGVDVIQRDDVDRETTVESCIQIPKEYGKRKRRASKIPKTNAQRQQIFRQNQKKIQESDTLDSILARKKYDAERSKRYRDRQKLRKQRGDFVLSSKEHPLPTVSIENEEKRHDTNCEELSFGQFQMQTNQIQPLMNTEAQRVITPSFQSFQAPYEECSMPSSVLRHEINIAGDGPAPPEVTYEMSDTSLVRVKTEPIDETAHR